VSRRVGVTAGVFVTQISLPTPYLGPRPKNAGVIRQERRRRQIVGPEDINEKGEISQGYFDSDGNQHGFAAIVGALQTIDVPGADTTDL
jgi:hypothetical protein